jgi:hypothetical protein
VKLAFLIRVAETLISSNSPKEYAVRKDAGDILKWCSEKGTLFLHTHLPEVSNAPEMLLDLTRILLKTDYTGTYRLWNKDQQVRNAAVRKSKGALGFLQPQMSLAGLNVDRITGYAELANEGFKIVHIGTGLTDIEKKQLKGLGGLFVEVPPLPTMENHEIQPVWDGGAIDSYIVKSADKRLVFDPTEHEVDFRFPRDFEDYVQKHGQSILNRHLDDLSPGILNHLIVSVVKEFGEGIARESVKKAVVAPGIDDRTADGINYWAGNLASRKAEDANEE